MAIVAKTALPNPKYRAHLNHHKFQEAVHIHAQVAIARPERSAVVIQSVVSHQTYATTLAMAGMETLYSAVRTCIASIQRQENVISIWLATRAEVRVGVVYVKQIKSITFHL